MGDGQGGSPGFNPSCDTSSATYALYVMQIGMQFISRSQYCKSFQQEHTFQKFYIQYYYNILQCATINKKNKIIEQRRSGRRRAKWLGKCLCEVMSLEVILKGSDRSRLPDSVERERVTDRSRCNA
jgi:hypothetical protein